LLLAFVGAVLAGTKQQAQTLRLKIRETMGDAAFVDVCATVASFNAVVRIADGSGIPLEKIKAESTVDIRDELGINQFRT